MKTRNTLLAQATTESAFGIYITAYPDDAVQEDKVKAHTTMRLVGERIVALQPRKALRGSPCDILKSCQIRPTDSRFGDQFCAF